MREKEGPARRESLGIGGGAYNFGKTLPWVTSSIGGWGTRLYFKKKRGGKLRNRALAASEVLS